MPSEPGTFMNRTLHTQIVYCHFVTHVTYRSRQNAIRGPLGIPRRDESCTVTIFTLGCSLSPKLWGNVLCLFKLKVKPQSSPGFDNLFASWTIPWMVVIIFIVSVYLPLRTTMFILSWFWLKNRHNPHILIFPSPKLWSNFLCLSKLRLNVAEKPHSSQKNC